MPHIPDLHADHDPLAIAAYAAGDAEGAELDAASALVATCHECAALHHDLRAISLALPSVPPPVRTRDFRLTPEQAASIRPSGWRRLVAPFAGPRFAFAGPLGTGLATLGLAGLLVGGSLGAPIAQAPAGGGPEQAMAPVPSDAAFLATKNGEGAPDASPMPELSPLAGSDRQAGQAGPASSVPAGDPESTTVPLPTGEIVVTGGAGTGGDGAYGNGGATGGDASEPPVDGGASPAAASGAPVAVQLPPDQASTAPHGANGPEDDQATASGEVNTSLPVDTAAPSPVNALVAVGGLLAVAGVLVAGVRVLARRVA